MSSVASQQLSTEIAASRPRVLVHLICDMSCVHLSFNNMLSARAGCGKWGVCVWVWVDFYGQTDGMKFWYRIIARGAASSCELVSCENHGKTS